MSILVHINAYKYIYSQMHHDKLLFHEDENWLGYGRGRSTHCRRCGEGIVEVLALAVLVTRASPCDGPGPRTTLDLTRF